MFLRTKLLSSWFLCFLQLFSKFDFHFHVYNRKQTDGAVGFFLILDGADCHYGVRVRTNAPSQWRLDVVEQERRESWILFRGSSCLLRGKFHKSLLWWVWVSGFRSKTLIIYLFSENNSDTKKQLLFEFRSVSLYRAIVEVNDFEPLPDTLQKWQFVNRFPKWRE